MTVDLEDEHRLSQMGTDVMSTVYAAELREIEMAPDWAQIEVGNQENEANHGVLIFADSQAALKALRRPECHQDRSTYLAASTPCVD
jgi:hypothetical protein